MTPKEKAKELYNKYEDSISGVEGSYWFESAKKCALVAVDEMLNELSIWGAPYLFETSVGNDWAEKRILYLIEVKKEIINL